MTYFKPTLALLAFAAAGAVISSPLQAWGQTASDAPPEAATLTAVETFALMDLDGNGLVSEGEFVAYAAVAHDATPEDARVKFGQIAGEDGVISLGEFETLHVAHAEKGDGKGS